MTRCRLVTAGCIIIWHYLYFGCRERVANTAPRPKSVNTKANRRIGSEASCEAHRPGGQRSPPAPKVAPRVRDGSEWHNVRGPLDVGGLVGWTGKDNDNSITVKCVWMWGCVGIRLVLSEDRQSVYGCHHTGSRRLNQDGIYDIVLICIILNTFDFQVNKNKQHSYIFKIP